MKKELVEKVMRALGAAWTDSDDPDNGWAFMARYAIALAERAAREAVALADSDRGDGATSASEAAISALAVERAVEGDALPSARKEG